MQQITKGSRGWGVVLQGEIMIQFDSKFFEAEARCGFEIEPMMKRAWACELKILSEVINICHKYELTYYADYGTLLGAVRHKGYVPWDDDIDIALKRSDYMMLMKVLKSELPRHYAINNCYESVTHRQPMSSVANYATFPVPKSVVDEFYGFPYVAGIDIYALDYVPREEEYANLQLSMYTMVYDMAQRLDEIRANGEVEKYLPQIEEICGVKLEDDKTLRSRLWQLGDRIQGMFTEQESDYLTYFPRIVQGNEGFKYKKEWYDDVIPMQFENIEIDVPVGYDEILKTLYGDYHQYQVGLSAHNYPFYKKQREYLEGIKK